MAQPVADLLFRDGVVFDGATDRPFAADVAVRGGRIAAVGPDAAALAGPSTEVVELGGRLLTPGFCDAHVHPVQGGARLAQCSLDEATTVEQYVQAVRRYADEHPHTEWILGGGWALGAFPGGRPTKEMLDAVVSDRPVSLINRDGHDSWVNSRALELAGIDASTPDPVDGRIERDHDGAPTGLLHEGASTLVNRFVPVPTADDLYAGLLTAQEYLFAHGITSWQDAMVGNSYLGSDVLPTYRRAAERGELLASVVGALWWDRDSGLEQVEELLERRVIGTHGRFSATTVKIMQDGIAENFTAAMSEPYLDACGCSTGNAGISFVPPALLNEAATVLDAHGFQLHFHALGDRAVTEALDALAAARAANGTRDHRHHLAHLQVVKASDVARFADLDVTANLQPLWASHDIQMDELTIPFLGQGLAARQYPFADLRDAGVRLAGGSDWPVSTPNVWHAAHVAVNRTSDVPAEQNTPRFLADQALTLAQVLTAYTAGSSFLNRREDAAGSLQVGKLADLAVHDRDPFSGPVEVIGDTRVNRTYVEGRLVHISE